MNGRRPAARLALVVDLVVEQMTELVQEPERNASADARDAHVDRVASAEAVRAGFGDRRRWSHRNRFEIGEEAVQPRCCRKRTLELPCERAAPW